jgi:hypothetical protein
MMRIPFTRRVRVNGRIHGAAMTDHGAIGAIPSSEDRVLDNTLPQSALHFVRYGGGRLLDVTATRAFDLFVDAYVNTPNRQVALPGGELGEGDLFIKLWQHGAQQLPNLGPRSDNPAQEQVLDSYASNLQSHGREWAGFLCFQLTSEIGFQYRSRVVDWETRLEQAASQIESDARSLPVIQEFRSSKLAPSAAALREGRTVHSIDTDYLAWLGARRMDLLTFMTAYGLDWYRRGYSYSRWAGNWVGWHELRRNAGLELGSQTGIKGELEVNWSSVLAAYLDRGLLPADELAIADLLSALRSQVQDDRSGFAKAWRTATSVEDPREQFRRTRDVIVDALLKVGVYPQKRLGAGKQIEALLNAMPQLLGASPDPAAMAARFAGELVKVANRTEPAAKLRFRVHRKLRPGSVWRAYEIPGLTTPAEPRQPSRQR